MYEAEWHGEGELFPVNYPVGSPSKRLPFPGSQTVKKKRARDERDLVRKKKPARPVPTVSIVPLTESLEQAKLK